jgi:hypothetical protein
MSQTIGIPQALAVLTPNAEWALTGTEYSGLVWLDATIPEPSEQEIQNEITTLTLQQPFDDCKKQASLLLYETDWTTISDVSDPAKSNPYLINPNDFVVYRSALRKLAVYPVANPVWPTKPTEQWSS